MNDLAQFLRIRSFCRCSVFEYDLLICPEAELYPLFSRSSWILPPKILNCHDVPYCCAQCVGVWSIPHRKLKHPARAINHPSVRHLMKSLICLILILSFFFPFSDGSTNPDSQASAAKKLGRSNSAAATSTRRSQSGGLLITGLISQLTFFISCWFLRR